MENKITKITKLLEVNNDMVHNYYYLVHGRLIDNKNKKYLKYKFVMLFDIFDVQEYFEKDIITKDDIKEYKNILSFDYIPYNIKDINDKEHIKEFLKECNSTIDNYNKIV